MTTPEVPAIDLPDAPVPQPNPLFENLVPATAQTRIDTGKLTFADAMPRMGMSSVFDIIREPKQAFATRLRTLSDADGEMAYDNALCYASQIARSFREDQVSSGRDIATSSQRSGVRALVDIGPSYPNLFQENWDEFCKVGAIEAMDGPVAYLGALRRFAAEKIEGNSTSPRRIPLAVRRPDLDRLVIDEQSTYRPIPMLDLVNDVLTQGIDKYQKEKSDERPVQQLLAEKKHPFVFPYHFAHQQVSLALGGDKPGLGELSYRISLALPGAGSAYGNVNRNNYSAQLAMSGLSPSLQNLLQAPSLFSHFYVSFYDLLNTSDFEGPDVYSFRPYNTAYVGFLLQPQTGVGSIEPEAASLMWQDNRGSTDVELLVCKAGSTKSLPLKFGARGHAFTWPMNYALDANGRQKKTLFISYSGDVDALPGAVGHSREVSILAKSWSGLESWSPAPVNVAPWRFTFTADADYSLTPEQRSFFQDHYGETFSHASTNPLTSLEHFLQATGLDSDRLEALLAVKSCSPIKTPHWKVLNPAAAVIPFPRSNHYGACYVNGVGGRDSGTHQYNSRDNAMGVSRESGSQKWRLTNTSLERFDRLQRMIRLQKATGLPFAQLDTLLIGSMRSEGDANAALQINANTLRALGTFRYFDKHYRINAEEFAAFLYHISPHATTGQVPLLDKAFNTPLLFDKPLIIDNVEFTLDSALPADQQTIAQLCASLGVQPGAEFERMATDTLTHVKPLRRSLAVVSSLYRQARIAQMFGLSIDECWHLIDLLGGADYRKRIASGLLKAPDATETKDILDVLMELDWAVRWLKANKLSVSGLRALIEAGLVPVAASSLLDRLQLLAVDAHANAISVAAVAGLNLPGTSTGAAIDWFAHLGAGAQALIDAQGLVNYSLLAVEDNDQARLKAQVVALVDNLDVATSSKPAAVDALSQFLLDALTQQQRLVEGLLQEHTTLLPELAGLVGHCASVSPQQLLTGVMQAWPANRIVNEIGIAAVLAQLHQISACAKAIDWAGLGARALRTFVVNPAWLGCESLWPLSLHSLHLLKTYDTLFNTLGQPEERLLSYLEQANAVVSKRPGKRQLAVHAHTCNAALASLLGWSESEVAVLTAQLPQHTAKTVAHIDWVRRAQALALETGLNATSLLQACALNADSPEADWQAIGQAAMAAAQA